MTLKLLIPAPCNLHCNSCMKSTAHTKQMTGMKCSICDRLLSWTNVGTSPVVQVDEEQTKEWLESDQKVKEEAEARCDGCESCSEPCGKKANFLVKSLTEC